MKNLITFLLLATLLSNCKDQKTSSSEHQVSPLTKNVGMKIPMDVAERWITRYRKTYNGRSQQTPIISQSSIIDLLDPVSGKLGLSFHRATDPSGNYHILVSAVKEGVPFLHAGKILDANSNTLLNVEDSEEWTERYKSGNHDGIWSHFFGTSVFEQSFSTIELHEAQNDQGVPQLLLFIWRSEYNSNGRAKGNSVDVYDASALCPNACNTSQI